MYTRVQTGIFLAAALAFIFCWMMIRPKRHHGQISHPTDSIRQSREPISKQLMAPLPTETILIPRPQVPVRFPDTVIMPDQEIIEDTSPYNPDISEKEWADIQLKTELFGKTATSTLVTLPDGTPVAPAVFAPAVQKTPTPNRIPFPTMVPAPTQIDVQPPKESFKPNSLDLPRAEGVIIETPIDAQMSKWTMYSPCSKRSHIQERTRTCIHDGIDGGKGCTFTKQTRRCIS